MMWMEVGQKVLEVRLALALGMSRLWNILRSFEGGMKALRIWGYASDNQA